MAKKPAKPPVKVKDIDSRKNPKGGTTKVGMKLV